MGGKRYSTEQIILKLRQVEIEMGRGVKVPEVCRSLGITKQTFYRWRERYGGLDRIEVRRSRGLLGIHSGLDGPKRLASEGMNELLGDRRLEERRGNSGLL